MPNSTSLGAPHPRRTAQRAPPPSFPAPAAFPHARGYPRQPGRSILSDVNFSAESRSSFRQLRAAAPLGGCSPWQPPLQYAERREEEKLPVRSCSRALCPPGLPAAPVGSACPLQLLNICISVWLADGLRPCYGGERAAARPPKGHHLLHPAPGKGHGRASAEHGPADKRLSAGEERWVDLEPP